MKYLAVFLVLICCACGSKSTYEGYKTFPKNEWIADSAVVFSFEIKENNRYYDVYANIRNSLKYPYYNLFLNYELVDASGKVLANKQLDNNLMNPKTGEPYGSGIGDLYDHDFKLLNRYLFAKSGIYTLKIKQDMRLDTLPEIMAVGMKVMPVE